MFNKDILKNKVDIMTESYLSSNIDENYGNSGIFNEDTFIEALENLDCVSEEFFYEPQFIPVLMQENAEGENRYFVEYDLLAKLMESKEIDDKDALDMVCECNDIHSDYVYLLIESEEFYINEMKEAGAKSGSELKETKMRNLTKSLNDLKAKGLKVAKKKSKNKKKKNKKKA